MASTDASLPFIREKYPQVRLVENGANLGFARGNNAGIRHATGEYVLILNPDTIIHPRALQNFVDSADAHPQSEAFGCRVLNRDGTNQNPARPLPTVRSFLISALCLRGLGHLSNYFESDTYVGWDGKTERQIGFQYGCCMLFRRPMLEQLGGFDERFFYHFEEVDLCCRVWKAGYPVLFCPEAEITHLGGQSVGRAPVRFKLETYRNRYRYFNKHFGAEGARQIRLVSLLHLGLRYIGLAVKQLFKPSELKRRPAQSAQSALAVELGAGPDPVPGRWQRAGKRLCLP